MKLITRTLEGEVYHAQWSELARVVGHCDALICDAPYSERTHAGADSAASRVNRGANRYNCERSRLAYASWNERDVQMFVDAWAPRTRGWMVSLTDHVLAPCWEKAMAKHGRLVFSPIACVEPGSRVRLVGDGPAQWSCWAVVSRPRSAAFAKWGSLPGAYVVPPGASTRGQTGPKGVTGGKPEWLMERLCEDYSRPGQTVVDPVCGAGTTALAAVRTGRRYVAGDADSTHAALAGRRLARMVQRPLMVV